MKSSAVSFAMLLAGWLFTTSGLAQNPGTPPYKVAILLFDNVEIIDYTGPYEVLGAAGLDVFTVSQDGKMLKTAMNMLVTPHYSIDSCPAFDILLIPGGGSSLPGKAGVGSIIANPVMMNWVKEKTAAAKHVMSVCNGAFILAHAGLLDGLEATTFWRAIPDLDTLLPNTKVVSDKRFTDNGKIITTAGLTSGIDGAFHLVEKLFGRGQAQTKALGLEYNWQPEANYARAALADKHMHFWLTDEGNAETLSREGNREHWQSKWRVTDLPAEKLFASTNESILKNNVWTTPHVIWQKAEKQPSEPYQSLWKFQDENGDWWNGVVSVTHVNGKNDDNILSIRVSKQ